MEGLGSAYINQKFHFLPHISANFLGTLVPRELTDKKKNLMTFPETFKTYIFAGGHSCNLTQFNANDTERILIHIGEHS